MEKRLGRLEQRLGPAPDHGRLTVISPNAWDDADREAWARASILHDTDAQDDLIEKYFGHRPGRRPGVISVIVTPAPVEVEEAGEDERAAWRARSEPR